MVITMTKEKVLITYLLCAITIAAATKHTGNVKEFNIVNKDKTEHANEHHTPTPSKGTETTKINVVHVISNKAKEKIDNENTKDNNNDEEEHFYTESDLEEAVSRPLDAPSSNEKNPEIQQIKHEIKDDDQLTDVYTESDLDATVSRDNDKHHVVKRSVVQDYADSPVIANGELIGEGSGEGSGDSLLV